MDDITWFRVTLSSDDSGKALFDWFDKCFSDANAPRDAAMFHLKENGDVYLFSPGAAIIARSLIADYAGTEYAAPKASEVDVLIANGLDVLFAPDK